MLLWFKVPFVQCAFLATRVCALCDTMFLSRKKVRAKADKAINSGMVESELEDYFTEIGSRDLAKLFMKLLDAAGVPDTPSKLVSHIADHAGFLTA